jgi:hypothetical protein
MKTMHLGCFHVWQPLVYSNREELSPCCDFGSHKIRARYKFHKTAPSWRDHLWITHLYSHPSCTVLLHKVHWRTEELQVLLHRLTMNVASNAAIHRELSSVGHKGERRPLASSLAEGASPESPAACTTRFLRNLLGAFAKLHVCPSLRTREITRLPLDGFSLNSTSEYFSKICP